ncbi:MAG: hypothetical protein KAS32_12175 [Candidatus Peribacteraceae bacterium]|nr:hypothetical protein [Candidatus Peribacteraceae bacterium]
MKIKKEINRLLRNLHETNFKVMAVAPMIAVEHKDKVMARVLINEEVITIKVKSSKLVSKMRKVNSNHNQAVASCKRAKQLKRYLKNLSYNEYERLIKGD